MKIARAAIVGDIAGRFFDRFIDAMAAVAGVCIAATALLTSAAVILRYAGRPIGWSIELTEYALLYITFLSAPWILRRGEHVRVDVLLDNVPKPVQRILKIFGALVGIAGAAAVSYYGAVLTQGAYVDGTYMVKTLRVPRYIVMGVIPFGSTMLVLQFVRLLAQLLTRDTPENRSRLVDGEAGG